ncbi:glycerophosphodiester phosphodiesterase [Enhygromyxa salina]|nr:glycerophosphodiester phosphodiesterase [Enhygromyxa salina]
MPYFQSEGIACFAHRGGAACWPENTLEAFRGGLAAGCPWIETDVHMTRDGHIVCHHDHDLRRTSDAAGKIWDHSLSELRRVDAGYRFTPDGHSYPFRGRGLTIPTLEEVAALDPAARINLEIKQANPPMIRALWQQIEALGLHDRVLVASADASLVRAFRALARGAVASSAGRAEIFAFWLAARAGLSSRLPIDYEALQVPTGFRGLEVVTAPFVEAAHRRGLQVHVWTIDDVEVMRRLIELGVDGIMTDQPRRLAKLVRELGLMPEVGIAEQLGTAPAPAPDDQDTAPSS